MRGREGREEPFSLFFSAQEFRQWFSKRPDRSTRSLILEARPPLTLRSVTPPPRLSPSYSFSLALRRTSILSAR